MRKYKRLTGVIIVFFVALLLFSVFLRQKYVVPILMYHSIHPVPVAGRMLTVSPAAFDRQMRFLKTRHYNVVSLERIAELIKNKQNIPPRTVAITFDDGYKDNFLYAFPILRKYGLLATMFIITNEVGRQQNDRLTWEEIKIMRDSGLVEFGSHCLGPEPLTKIASEESVKNEIFGSKKVLEDKINMPVNVFSYPEGRFNKKIRQMVIDAGYQAAVATNPGRQYDKEDIFALKRLRISENARNMFVFWFEVSGFYTFLKEQRRK